MSHKVTQKAQKSQIFPKKFGDIKRNVYLCTVKTFKGHEAAAPKKAAYFVQQRAKKQLSGTAWGIGNDPKGTSLE